MKMTSTEVMAIDLNKKDKINVLVDLKPALDGYAGIPQESRLLFAALRRLGGAFDVEGMLQHGSGYIASEIAGEEARSPNERVIANSRTVVSFCRNAARVYIPGLPKRWQHHIALQVLRWHAFRKKPIKMGVFEAEMFDDFVWRFLFAKSVDSNYKNLLVSSRFRIINHSRKSFHKTGLKGLTRFARPRYPRLDTTGYDFLLAQTPFPARVSRNTRLIIRYHDAIPVFMPHTINDASFHQLSHYRALKDNVDAGAYFVCASEASRADLLKMFPEVESRADVIHNIVSAAYHASDEPKHYIPSILSNYSAEPNSSFSNFSRGRLQMEDADNISGNYLLMVSTLEPRKNHELLISAWQRLRHDCMSNLKLVLVGNRGWKYEPILAAMRPAIRRGELFHLTNVPDSELRVLYRHAAATICPALAEGFDYTGIEAMRCGCLVISSDIPVHREIYGEASIYFNPYSVDHAVEVIGKALADDSVEMRSKLMEAARRVSGRYEEKNISIKWVEYFQDKHAEILGE